tara:strand:+ start:107 stop:475 length:369 start_codon:yes stop_codon:yes gene_type:complete
MSFSALMLLIVIGLLSGSLSGLVGVGGGIIMIPLLISFFGFTQLNAQGTAIAAMLPPIGILAAINYYQEGYVRWEYSLVIAIAFVVGGFFGSKLSISISQHLVRQIFAIILFIVALKLFFSK